MNTEVQPAEAEVTAIIDDSLPCKGSRFSAVARDLATMSSGTAFAALFNTLLVFLIPRLVSVEDFGYWRLFLLYTGYAGLLHMGFADGALLRWAGRPLEEFRHELAPSMQFVLWQHLAVLVPASLAFALLLPSPLNVIGIAVFVVSWIMNSTLVLQYALQSARLFRPVAIATAAPAGGFVFLAFLWNLRGAPGFREMIILYCTAWAGALVYLWVQTRPQGNSLSLDPSWSLGKTCILLGWPVVLANVGFGLVQSADRLVVSIALPIFDFAQYSLAASTMFVPVAAIATVYRVFFSHVAAVQHEDRAKVYSRASKFLLLAWSLLLPYYFVLEVLVRHILPKYAPALPIARILLLGVIFLAGIQVLHMSFAYLYGKQRQFLVLTIGALGMSILLILVLVLWLHSLVAVAIGQVVALAFWWLFNEWNLRKTTGQHWNDWLRVMALFGWSLASYGMSMRFSDQSVWRISIYYLLVISVLWRACSDEFRIVWKIGNLGAASLLQ